MGKHKPIFDPSTDCGDYVVAVGCHDLRTTGKKRFQKLYYTHNTRPGSLKSMTMDKMIEKWGGGEVLRRAVKGMLPKNRLQSKRLARLKSECLLWAISLGDLANLLQPSRVFIIRTRRTLSSTATSRLLEACLKFSMLSRLRPPRRRRRENCRLFVLLSICNPYFLYCFHDQAHRWAFCDYTTPRVSYVFSTQDDRCRTEVMLLYYRNAKMNTLSRQLNYANG